MKNLQKRFYEKRYVRKAFPAAVAMLALVFAASCLQVQASESANTTLSKAPPEFVDINIQKTCPEIPGLKKDVKSVNHFSHKAHIDFLKNNNKEFVCAKCHQGAKTEADVTGADKCQRLEEEFKAVGGKSNPKDYFHAQCLGCHKALKKEGESTGPTSCKGCHSRKGG